MLRHGKLGLCALLLALVAAIGPGGFSPRLAQAVPQAPDEVNADEKREHLVMERFLSVLEKNPRRGTALDRLYGFHVERGTLDKFIAQFADRTKTEPKDGAAWMLIGLLEAQRGKEAAAVVAFKESEKHRPDDALPCYYLGQSLVMVGQPDAAAEAFERAIKRQPNRNDLLDIFQALGRVYQRAQKTEQAIAVWTRLEQQFPDDMRVQEQIATTLAEEGQFEQALPRYDKLAKAVKDPYRQATFRMEAAELKVRLKRGPQALTDLETLLGELNPDSWLYRDVRRKIDEVFLRNDDLAGLAKYYEGYVVKNPDDVEAIARLARALATQGRVPESREWLKKAVEKAPSRRELRQAMIEQYVAEQKYADAIAQYEAMDKHDPNNPDTLRDWGRLILRDQSKAEAERKAAAVAVWLRLLDRRKDDPVATAQVADLVRAAGLTDKAVELYQKAVALAPNSAQYREYLGEYLHSLKRKDEALAAWRPIAEGANRNAKNLARLAEVFAGFGYRTEAISTLADALTLEKDDFNLIVRYADLLHQDEKNDDSLKQLDSAFKLATNAEEVEIVMQAQIKVYTATDSLGKRIEDLQKELNAGQDATADRWHRLARYHEAAKSIPAATAAILKAVDKDAKSIPVLASAARIHESGGNLLAAADTLRKLAAVDRRFRTEYLTNIAKLEARLGRREQALQAGRDLLAAAPGNPEHFKFYADLCFQLGEGDEGLESLRKSVRVNPSDPQGLLTLSQALSDRFRTGEAIELLWRAFEKTNELEGKTGIIARLTELYLQNNQFDKLMERLERERREADKQREMTICIAQAYQTAGDLGTARQQLERLLTENARDTQLLGQLSQLAENEGDVTNAVKYQRQLEKAAPTNRDARLRLAQLLVKAGESEDAATIWVDLVTNDPEPHRNHQAIDALIANSKHDTALAVLTRMSAQKPGDWELLYREGVTLAALQKRDDAAKRFKAILDLKTSDEEDSAAAKWRKKQRPGRQVGTAVASARQAAAQSQMAFQAESVPLQARQSAVYQIRAACGLDMQDRYYGPGGGQQQFRIWAPDDFGQARLAALGWLFNFAQKENKQDEFTKAARETKDKAGTDGRAKWDWLYFQMIKQDQTGSWEAAKDMAGIPDPAASWAFLSHLSSRTGQNRRVVSSRRAPGEDTTPALPANDLEQVMAAFRRVKQQKPEWITSNILQNVLKELKRANRPADGDLIYKEAFGAAVKADQIQQVLAISAERGDVATAMQLFDRLDKLPPTGRGNAPPTRAAVTALSSLMKPRADAKAHADLLTICETYLASHRKFRLTNPPKPGSSSSTTAQVRYTQMQPGGYGRTMMVDYPPANDYYDAGAIQLFRTAFEYFKRDDVVSDLIAHFKKKLDAAPPAEKIEWQLGLGYVYWWNQEKEQALAELTAATALIPQDTNMKFELAGLRERNNEPDEALTILDGITPLDHTTMQKREEQALRLAVRTGNVDRARLAADRLFGLRLDAEKQVDLASQMHRLGMHEAAETVLARASRQAGNRTAALIRLMSQYQSQNQPDLAIQIARQLLRKGPSMTFQPYRYGGETGDGRSEAIQVLARSGKLNEMIERAEAQLKSSPKSLPVYQTLLDYYKAAGDKDKLKATALTMVEVKPDDARTRFQIAQEFQQLNDHKAAAEQYALALRKEPSLFSYRYWEIMEVFQQAKMTDELMKVFDELDAKSMGGQYYVYIELVQPLLADEKTREQGMKLFRKAWQAFPEYRTYMMSNFYDDSLWQLPELYEFAREAVIPQKEMFPDPWHGSDQIINYSGDGRVTGLFTRLLDVARKQNRLVALGRDVDEALKKYPTWSAGKALKVILDLQRGKTAEARKAWTELVENKKDPLPGMAGFLFGQEIENYAAMRDLIQKTYETAAEEALKEQYFDLSYSPVKRLVKLYEQEDRKADAKALVQKCLNAKVDEQYDPGYNAYRKINTGMSAAQMLQELGFTVEAVRLYGSLLDDNDTLDMASRYYGGSGPRANIEQLLKTALKTLKPDEVPESVRELLQPRQDAKNGQALDLMVLVPNRTLSETTVASVLAQSVEAAAKTPQLKAEVTAKLTELAGRLPRDLSVQIGAALGAFMEDNPTKAAEAVDRLVKLVEETPLEPLPPNGRANSRQRAAAVPHIAVWLVARECLKKDALKAQGAKLGERALAAAKRQLEPVYSLAILREWGQLEGDRGDKAAAEKRWGEMLELVIPPPAPKKAAKADHHNEPLAAMPPASFIQSLVVSMLVLQVPAPPAMAKAAPATASRAGPMVPVVTIGQFDQAKQIAQMATEKDMHTLAQKAIRDALRGGPPGNNPQPNDPRRGVAYSTAVGPGGMSTATADQANPFGGQVETAVNALVGKWKRAGVPPADIYDTLVAVVMPDARPAEVFLYVRPLSYTAADKPRSLGLLLAETAAAVGKLDDLRKRVEARQTQPLAELSARVLLAHAAVADPDAARLTALLEWFAQRMQKDTLQNTAELVAHVALPALDKPVHEAAALALLEKAAKNLANSRAERQANGLMLLVARHYFARNRADDARAMLKDVMARTMKNALRGGGDQAIAQQAQQVAREYIRAGMLAEALEMMGMATDLPPALRRYIPTDILSEMTGIFYRQFSPRPAAERLALIKPWALPTAARKSVRLIGSFVPTDVPPPVFGTPPSPPDGVVSTAGLMIDAAKETGQLDALAAELKKLADEKVENARPVYWLAEIARGQGATVAKELGEHVVEFKKKLDAPAPPQQPGGRRMYYPGMDEEEPQEVVNWSDYLLTRACLYDPALVPLGEGLGEQLLRQATKVKNWPMIIQLRNDLALAKARRVAKPQTGNPRDLGLAYWHPAGTLGRTTQAGNRIPAWWVAQEGHVAHLLGPDQQYLLFDLPLTGKFTFSLDAFEGQFAEGHVGYAGIVYEANQGAAASTVWPIGKHENYYRFPDAMRFEAFNRYTFDVDGKKVTVSINGRRFHEIDDNAPTSPWLTLFCSRERHTVFRNFKLEGTPEVPREVKLVDGDRITGWVGALYGETQPPRLKRDEPDPRYGHSEDYDYDEYGNAVRRRQPEPASYDWQAKDGVIEGRRLDDPGAKFTPSHLAYFRPLRAGESLRYEFLHKPGDTEAHPCLGRAAFLLDPEGIKLHWLTGGGDDDWTGLKPDNTRVVLEHRRGPKQLPLKAGDWNTLVVKMGPTAATLELNGTAVYEYPLGPDGDRSFGLFHDKGRTVLRVRNVVLSGDWPTSLPTNAMKDLLVRADAESMDGPTRRKLVGESFFPKNAPPTLLAARALTPAERYAKLASFVLPGADRPVFQLAADYSPTNPARVATTEQPAGPRGVVGGEIEAPALELVAVAKELNRLPELLAKVEAAEITADPRGKLAMLAVVNAALGRDDEVAPALAQLTLLAEKLAPDTPTWQRWPELVAVAGTYDRPGSNAAARMLLDVLVKQGRDIIVNKVPVADGDRFLLSAHHYLARASRPGVPFATDPGLAYWAPVNHATAHTRGGGKPKPLWLAADGMVTHLPGHDQDALYFRSPLRGEFEVHAELTTFNWREAYLGYGGARFEVKHDRKSFDLYTVTQKLRSGKIDPPLPELGDWYKYRLVVKEGSWKAFINDRELCEEPLPADADPWLTLATHAGNTAGFRNVRIVGSPTILASVDLLGTSDLTGWSSYTGDPVGGEHGMWARRGEELYGMGPQRTNYGYYAVATTKPPRRTWQERAVHYHRPLLEDGVVTYEFFHEPGKMHVHPALDRLCVLMEPQGVRIHWLTDGASERTELKPDNATTEAAHRRGPTEMPLKAKAWNKVEVSLAGDTVTVKLNDVEVYQRPLEATNQRTFGFFHYGDETGARVRNVTYAGAWPKALPKDGEMFRVR